MVDVNRDGQLHLVVNETAPPRALVWFEAPHWIRHVIDTGVDTADVIPAELFGRRGILVVHRRAQVRGSRVSGLKTHHFAVFFIAG